MLSPVDKNNSSTELALYNYMLDISEIFFSSLSSAEDDLLADEIREISRKGQFNLSSFVSKTVFNIGEAMFNRDNSGRKIFQKQARLAFKRNFDSGEGKKSLISLFTESKLLHSYDRFKNISDFKLVECSPVSFADSAAKLLLKDSFNIAFNIAGEFKRFFEGMRYCFPYHTEKDFKELFLTGDDNERINRLSPFVLQTLPVIYEQKKGSTTGSPVSFYSALFSLENSLNLTKNEIALLLRVSPYISFDREKELLKERDLYVSDKNALSNRELAFEVLERLEANNFDWLFTAGHFDMYLKKQQRIPDITTLPPIISLSPDYLKNNLAFFIDENNFELYTESLLKLQKLVKLSSKDIIQNILLCQNMMQNTVKSMFIMLDETNEQRIDFNLFSPFFKMLFTAVSEIINLVLPGISPEEQRNLTSCVFFFELVERYSPEKLPGKIKEKFFQARYIMEQSFGVDFYKDQKIPAILYKNFGIKDISLSPLFGNPPSESLARFRRDFEPHILEELLDIWLFLNSEGIPTTSLLTKEDSFTGKLIIKTGELQLLLKTEADLMKKSLRNTFSEVIARHAHNNGIEDIFTCLSLSGFLGDEESYKYLPVVSNDCLKHYKDIPCEHFFSCSDDSLLEITELLEKEYRVNKNKTTITKKSFDRFLFLLFLNLRKKIHKEHRRISDRHSAEMLFSLLEKIDMKELEKEHEVLKIPSVWIAGKIFTDNICKDLSKYLVKRMESKSYPFLLAFIAVQDTIRSLTPFFKFKNIQVPKRYELFLNTIRNVDLQKKIIDNSSGMDTKLLPFYRSNSTIDSVSYPDMILSNTNCLSAGKDLSENPELWIKEIKDLFFSNSKDIKPDDIKPVDSSVSLDTVARTLFQTPLQGYDIFKDFSRTEKEQMLLFLTKKDDMFDPVRKHLIKMFLSNKENDFFQSENNDFWIELLKSGPEDLNSRNLFWRHLKENKMFLISTKKPFAVSENIFNYRHVIDSLRRFLCSESSIPLWEEFLATGQYEMLSLLNFSDRFSRTKTETLLNTVELPETLSRDLDRETFKKLLDFGIMPSWKNIADSQQISFFESVKVLADRWSLKMNSGEFFTEETFFCLTYDFVKNLFSEKNVSAFKSLAEEDPLKASSVMEDIAKVLLITPESIDFFESLQPQNVKEDLVEILETLQNSLVEIDFVKESLNNNQLQAHKNFENIENFSRFYKKTEGYFNRKVDMNMRKLFLANERKQSVTMFVEQFKKKMETLFLLKTSENNCDNCLLTDVLDVF